MIQTKATINFNKKLNAKYYQMSLTCPSIAKGTLPGQFIHVDVASKKVFLRRPFSIYKAGGRNIEILYKIIGAGTEALSEKKKNQTLDIIGPLGNGYKTEEINKNDKVVLVVGGTGIASLFFLANRLNSKKLFLIGAKTKTELVNIKELKDIGCNVKVATDDGSKGYKGFVSSLLKKTVKKEKISYIYACGPKPMLKEIARISKSHKIPCQVSLEEHMACGVGVCMGCAVKIKEKESFEYKRACKEGPVFNGQEVIWE